MPDDVILYSLIVFVLHTLNIFSIRSRLYSLANKQGVQLLKMIIFKLYAKIRAYLKDNESLSNTVSEG